MRLEKDILINYEGIYYKAAKQIFDKKGNYYLLIFRDDVDFIKYSIHSRRNNKIQTHFKYKTKEESKEQYFGGTINSFEDFTSYQISNIASFTLLPAGLKALKTKTSIEENDIVLLLEPNEDWSGKYSVNLSIEAVPMIKQELWIEYYNLQYTEFRYARNSILFSFIKEELPNKFNLLYSLIATVPDRVHEANIAETEFIERTGIFDTESKSKEQVKNQIISETNNHSVWIDKTSMLPKQCNHLINVCNKLNQLHRLKRIEDEHWLEIQKLERVFFDISHGLMNNLNLESFKVESIGK